jgi:deazaflavin-dependent oxidoreductase (nitroreductase family)
MTIKVPAKGSRGALFPRFIARLTNGLSVRRFRGGKMGEVAGAPVLVLETRGAQTGKVRRAALGFFDDGEGSRLVIASTGGAAWNPGWLYNLAHDPDATVELGGGRRIPVHAETLTGPELEAAWARIAGQAPAYDAYRTKTDRVITVVRLRDRTPG